MDLSQEPNHTASHDTSQASQHPPDIFTNEFANSGDSSSETSSQASQVTIREREENSPWGKPSSQSEHSNSNLAETTMKIINEDGEEVAYDFSGEKKKRGANSPAEKAAPQKKGFLENFPPLTSNQQGGAIRKMRDQKK